MPTSGTHRQAAGETPPPRVPRTRGSRGRAWDGTASRRPRRATRGRPARADCLLGCARQPLFVASPLDDHVAVAEADRGACAALLVPEIGDLLVEPTMLGAELR